MQSSKMKPYNMTVFSMVFVVIPKLYKSTNGRSLQFEKTEYSRNEVQGLPCIPFFRSSELAPSPDPAARTPAFNSLNPLVKVLCYFKNWEDESSPPVQMFLLEHRFRCLNHTVQPMRPSKSLNNQLSLSPPFLISKLNSLIAICF
uniref:Uncharacterized protein n=1 Tax=Nelumbo nucifera TaxID=4432 RepID=A0A822XES1_NELNU|nr:TPA_asm: hypothetical protein HUJ06_019855 [Nelumbo nucifera]